jgi:diadenylate cyclase
MGITEETDAIALVVSEETGALSLCYQGKLEHDLEPDELRQRINEILSGDSNGDGTPVKKDKEEGHELGHTI